MSPVWVSEDKKDEPAADKNEELEACVGQGEGQPRGPLTTFADITRKKQLNIWNGFKCEEVRILAFLELVNNCWAGENQPQWPNMPIPRSVQTPITCQWRRFIAVIEIKFTIRKY